MKRREFIAGIGGAATPSFLWRLAARAQQAQKQRRIKALGPDLSPTLIARADEVIE